MIFDGQIEPSKEKNRNKKYFPSWLRCYDKIPSPLRGACVFFVKWTQTCYVVVDLLSQFSTGALGCDHTVTDCWRSSLLLPVPGRVLKRNSPSPANLLAHRERLAPLYASAWQRPMLTKWPIPVCQLSPSAKMALGRFFNARCLPSAL